MIAYQCDSCKRFYTEEKNMKHIKISSITCLQSLHMRKDICYKCVEKIYDMFSEEEKDDNDIK